MNAERRNGYTYNRVLIEASRVLDAQHEDAVVFLTGAQIEMLRNVCQYLNRRDTYVSEYKLGYYIAVSEEDYDTILAIVADLEESLMGNPNTIWGYNDRWGESQILDGVGVGETEVETDPVPEGYVYVLQHFAAIHTDAATHASTLYAICSSTWGFLYSAPALSGNVWVNEATTVTLKEGDFIRWRVTDLPADKVAALRVLGYKMKVPA